MTKEKRQAIYAGDAHGYIFTHHSNYDFEKLKGCVLAYERKGRAKDTRTINDCIIMADTETSKKDPERIYHNHVVAWTISLRANGANLLTLWGHRPDTLVDTMEELHNSLPGDRTFIFFHNMPYDYVFIRRFLFDKWGYPDQALNVKPHYPLFLEFSNGIMLRDSLMIAQRKLEKWADDLDVKHKKQVGKWDYDRIRSQHETFTADELQYIENDTLAGVECIDKTMIALNKHIYSLPYTATGIPRGESRERSKGHRPKDLFLRLLPSWEQQKVLEHVFHGGYTHANRYYIEECMIGRIVCYDIASSYPYRMLTNKFPMEKFTPLEGAVKVEDILSSADNYAYYFKLILTNPRLKDPHYPMPVLQYSKTVKTLDPIIDNGRILAAHYLEIWITEQDLILINEQYYADMWACVDVNAAEKDYLPKWYRDYVYERFEQKTRLKGGDPVLYDLAKAKLNALYGMMVQKPVKEDIIENYKYSDDCQDEESRPYDVVTDKDMEALYEKWGQKKTSILAYQWGVWVTAYALVALYRLGDCVGDNDIWIYSDTDSVYATGWNERKLKAYNDECIRQIKEAGYKPIRHAGKDYCPGVAEIDGVYTEFKVTGAKRYCKRYAADPVNKEKNWGKLAITVAGVPKSGAECLNDNIDNFRTGTKFIGSVTGKKQHTYFYNEIYTDDQGNLTGDSIDLSSCDYILDSIEVIPNWELMFYDEVEVQTYGEG